MLTRSLSVALIALLTCVQILAQNNPSAELTDVPGRITYVGADHNIYTYDLSTEETFALTDDASTERRYQWFAVAPDGRVAYFCCNLTFAASPNTQAYISTDGLSSGQEVFSGTAEMVIYAQWAPQSCSIGGGCRDLAMLVNNVLTGDLHMEVVRDDDPVSSREIASGAPFYYQFSPDGSEMIFHRFGARLEFYDLNTDELILAVDEPSSGTFQSAAWSPVDDRVLYGLRGEDSNTTTLTILENTDQRALIEELTGVVGFLWSPDGRYIAFRTASAETGFGALFVVDSRTGEVVRRSSVNGVLAFFWAPDSQKIAYLTLANTGATVQQGNRKFIQQDVPRMTWSTLNVETGLNRTLQSFLPTSEMVYLMQYFDQFAVGHRIWSPDSQYIVFTEQPGSGDNTEPSVTVIDVTDDNTEPISIGSGLFAGWSFN